MSKEQTKVIGLEVNIRNYNQAKDLAEREGWSMRQVARKSLEYYLKLRGYKIK